MKNKLILIGGGGHGKVVIDAVKRSGAFEIFGVVDPNIAPGTSVMGVHVLGGDDLLPGLFGKGFRHAFLGVGSVGNCDLRKKLSAYARGIGFTLPVIVHPAAIIADGVTLGDGTFVAAGVVVNAGAAIGRDVIINTSSSIDHDCVIGDHVHIAPGVTLSGGVSIGEETHVGTGANVTQCLSIGRGCTIGAGQTVRHDMPDGRKSYAQNTEAYGKA